MSYETIAAARRRLGAAARACNEHIDGCRPCGRALLTNAQLRASRRPVRLDDDGRCEHGARLAAEVTAAGMELEQETELTSYADSH